ncbi:MAG: hypothetical protein MUC31_00440 [Bacteroidales bacterium]|jgi:hypothetical protein|nr:hypothetical protein [Bacteroidales bacterium]
MNITLSREVINRVIMATEVGYAHPDNWSYYNKRCSKPIVPAPDTTTSGVTVGIGYDCGQQTAQKILNDWSPYIPLAQAQRLAATAGLKKHAALAEANKMQDIIIPIDIALKQWYEKKLATAAKQAVSIYPNLPNLHPYEQTCLVSLVFNRGADLEGDRRKEMKDLVAATNLRDDKAMGKLFRDMKRLWPDTRGLQIRRDLEADFIEMANTPIPEADKLVVTV